MDYRSLSKFNSIRLYFKRSVYNSSSFPISSINRNRHSIYLLIQNKLKMLIDGLQKAFLNVGRTQKYLILSEPPQFRFFNIFSKEKFNEQRQEKAKQKSLNFQKSEEARQAREGPTPQQFLAAQAQQANKDESTLGPSTTDVDVFTTKQQYFKKLVSDRERIEQQYLKHQQAIEFSEKRIFREIEVKVALEDYASIQHQNLNILPDSQFKNSESLLYFISNLRVRLNEENLKQCIDGFLSLADKITKKELESPKFMEFVDIVTWNMNVVTENETLSRIAQFGDLYCLQSDHFWETLERRVLAKFNAGQNTIGYLISSLGHFSNQKQGTDFFYDQVEQLLTPFLSNLKYKELVSICGCYFRMKKGTNQFFKQVENQVMLRLQQCDSEDISKISQVFAHVKKNKQMIFEKFEAKVFDLKDQITWQQSCVIAEGFGFELGQNELFEILEKKIFQKFDTLSFTEIDPIVKGFILTYRGSIELFLKLKQILMLNLDQINCIDAAKLVKAYHIAEVDDREIYFQLQRLIVSRLKDVSKVTIEEILQIVKTYTITRNGSREIYQLLEIVIKHRFDDIRVNDTILKGIFIYYTQSGLCSPELLKQMEVLV